MHPITRRWWNLVLATAVATGATALLASSSAAQDTTAARGKEKGGARKDGGKAKAKGDGDQAPKATSRQKILKDSLEAERRPLFATREPLAFTLVADFNRIGKDRDSTSKVRYPGTLVVKDTTGAERRLQVQLRTRGHFRLRRSTCRFVNLLVILPSRNAELAGTPFDGQKSLKLGAHCQDDRRYDQVLRREYLSYRIANAFSPRTFRARLATGTYIDSATGRPIATRPALWIENEDEVAARMGGKLREFRRALFADMHAPTLDQMAIIQYAIGNTDWSIYALHNIRLVVSDSGVFPVPYDFDFSGLVSAPYATPAPQLAIRSVRDRLYRGPCRTWEEIEPTVALFAARREVVMSEVDSVPGLPADDNRDVKNYLGDFFRVVENPKSARSEFIDGCLKKPGA